MLENASAADLQLISIGLSEFVNGYGIIGGKRSRGLGACILEDFKVTIIDLESQDETERYRRLKDHLSKTLLNQRMVELLLPTRLRLLFHKEIRRG